MYNSFMTLYDQLTQQEKAFHDSLVDIVQKYGPFDQASSSIWVGYIEASDNEDKNIGVKCSNCSFYNPENNGCALVSFKVQPEAICRLAAIPDGLVNADEEDNDDMDMSKFWKGIF